MLIIFGRKKFLQYTLGQKCIDVLRHNIFENSVVKWFNEVQFKLPEGAKNCGICVHMKSFKIK